MNKLITSMLLTIGLLLGGAAIAPAANADTTTSCDLFGQCQEPCDLFTPCAEPCNLFEDCTGSAQSGQVADLSQRLYTAEQTVQEYRGQIASLQGKVIDLQTQTAGLREQITHVQRIADRRAATIQRLRAKIRLTR